MRKTTTECNITEVGIERLTLPLQEAMEVVQHYKSSSCSLRDNKMAGEFQGNVQLGCAVYDSNKYKTAPSVSTLLADFQKLKYVYKIYRQRR